MGHRLDLEIRAQPDETTCGPTCLHAVYGFFGEDLDLDQVVREIEPLETGGTLAVHLACHALERGYAATIYTYNLKIFDPTWFAPKVDLATKLRAQMEVKDGVRLAVATREYLRFHALGGEVRFEVLSDDLLRRYLSRNIPILTGLSATYLYRCARETGRFKIRADDVGGQPSGHFVVLSGYEPVSRLVQVADPWREPKAFDAHYYEVSVEHLIGAIMLGALTYDANLLVLQPRSEE